MTKKEAQDVYDDIHASVYKINQEIQNIKHKASDFDTPGHDLDMANKSLNMYLMKLQDEIEDIKDEEK
jgi:hypothetical protein